MKKNVLIDLSGLIDEETFHEYVSKKLDFPGYYGFNFDAFWDCLTDEDQFDSNFRLRVEGLGEFQRHLPDVHKKFIQCMHDYKSKFPERNLILIDDSPSGKGIGFEDDFRK
ncbi:barstar family protein [Flavobacteriaceae bacterium 3-367]|uniref:barstar family protein n=1 Tax=Eudoraea algarum TaxID=3417568 RepID=UPI00326BA697